MEQTEITDRSAKSSSSTVEKSTITIPDVRANDRISYRTGAAWNTAKVLLVKPIGVVAIGENKTVLRLGWGDVFPPF